jgi:hypothetical protein
MMMPGLARTMNQKIKLYTHEVIVHSQISALEKTLNRSIEYKLSLNSRTERSYLQFEADTKEIEKIKSELGYTVSILDGNHWIPGI